MLIDEADVFMEKREASSLKRNELVAGKVAKVAQQIRSNAMQFFFDSSSTMRTLYSSPSIESREWIRRLSLV